MSSWSKILSAILIALLGTLTSLAVLVAQGNALRQHVEAYPPAAVQIHLQGVAEDRSAQILRVLASFAGQLDRAIVRIDQKRTSQSGEFTGLRIGIAAAADAPPAALELEFLGTPLVTSPQLSQLLSSDLSTSIGLDANAADVLADIPEFLFSPQLSIVHLSHLVETSETINGTYQIVGADQAQVAALLSELEPLTDQSAQSLLTPMTGASTDSGLFGEFFIGFIIAAALFLLVILILQAFRSFRTLGVHLLLGESTWGFTAVLFRPVLIAAAVTAVWSFALTTALMHGYHITPSLSARAGFAAAIASGVVIICVVIAAAMLIAVKPVNAIRGRYSHKLLLSGLIGFYLLTTAAFSAMLSSIDAPLTEARTLASVSSSWAKVEDQQILYFESVGDDQSSFTGQSSKYGQDFYTWYASIADEPGVSLINTQHYSQEILDIWQGVFASVPEQPFWYVAASPSALQSMQFPVSDELVARAKRGERIFLMPSSWTDSRKSSTRLWLDERSRNSRDPSIRTEYFDTQQVDFAEYEPNTPVFTWNTDPALTQNVNDPVILISTPANMIPFESESLRAVGLANSYIKLSETAAANFTNAEYLAQFDLDDNAPTFLPIRDFIAGLTKSIQTVLQLFGSVLIVLSLFSLVGLAALARLYATINREALAVKRLLGYSTTRLFLPAFVIVAGTGVVAASIAIISSTKTALIGNVILSTAQLLILWLLARQLTRLQLSTALKEEA